MLMPADRALSTNPCCGPPSEVNEPNASNGYRWFGAEEPLGDHPAGGFGVHDDPGLPDAGVHEGRRGDNGDENDDDGNHG